MTALIECRSLSVNRDGRAVLRDAGFSLAPGERLAVLGPNGSGKTTLLRTLMGLERPESGSIVLFGRDCRAEADFREERPRIGYLFQDSDDQLFCPTVLEDVAFGPLNIGYRNEEALHLATTVLEQLGIAALADRVTHRLSGGEKRLVCLAGLLAMKPRVLVLDEPTNGVDAEHDRRLRDILGRFEGAILMVSHDHEFVSALATRALILRDGCLSATEEVPAPIG